VPGYGAAMPTAEQLTEPVAEHGEGPVWDAAGNRLLCVDMEVGDLLAVDPSSGAVQRAHVDDVLALLRPRRAGGWAMGVRRGFALLDGDVDALLAGSLAPRKLPELWSTDAVRMNEGGCDPQGRLYCGSMAYEQTPGAGSLYRLDPDGSTRVVLEGTTVSNGLGWSPDGSRTYYVDTPTRRVDLLHVDPATGDVVGREPFVEVPEGPGDPDGLTVDAEGGVWVALYGGGGVLHYDAAGTLLERVDVPTPNTTACALGGPGLSTLFVTTSQQGLDTSAEPLAGAVFTHAAGVAGLPPLPFAG
jgi:sugar lactone lactonase YvrE